MASLFSPLGEEDELFPARPRRVSGAALLRGERVTDGGRVVRERQADQPGRLLFGVMEKRGSESAGNVCRVAATASLFRSEITYTVRASPLLCLFARQAAMTTTDYI